MKIAIKYSVATLVTGLLAWLLYYLTMPAVNLTNPAFWWYMIAVAAILAVGFLIVGFTEEFYMPAGLVAIIAAVLFVILLIGLYVDSPMCSASKYYDRLKIENTTFEQEFSEVDWNTVPQIDKDSSAILGK